MSIPILRCIGLVASIAVLPAAGYALDPVCLYFAGRESTTSEALVVGFLAGLQLNLALLSVAGGASKPSKEVA